MKLKMLSVVQDEVSQKQFQADQFVLIAFTYIKVPTVRAKELFTDTMS